MECFCSFSAFMLLLTVSIYGARWADDRYEGPDYDGTLNYSFAFEILCLFSETAGAGLMFLDLFMFNKPIHE